MSRSSLPQNYMVSNGILFEDFEAVGDFTTIGTDGTIAANTSQYRTGSQSLKLSVTTPGSWIMARKILPAAVDLRAASKAMHIWFYSHSVPSTTVNEVLIQLTSTSDLSKSMNLSLSGADLLDEGWTHLVIPRSRWTVVNGETWNAIIRMYIKLVAKTGQTASISIDEFRHSTEQLPRCIIAFDDGRTSAYSEGFSYMSARGVPGTLYTVPALVGTDGYMTLAQVDELYDAGWALANHTYTHPGAPDYLTGLSQAQIEDEIQQCTDWLIAQGYTRAAYYLAYPGGVYNADVLAAMDACGILTGRTTRSSLQYAPVDNLKLLNSKALDSGTTLAAAKTLVDNAITQQSTVVFHGHSLEAAAGANTWAIADFRALIDYIAARRIQCVTIDEWYQGLTNPRYRAVPLSRVAV
ncbi:MAG: polysaccharide deacetylase family protein [bacterium]